MSPTQIMAEKLISEFTGNYMEKLFYFCLRKTGNTHEAEDLAQDVTLNVVYGLKKGHIPDSFSAWVWKIARNRYYLWAKRKHITSENTSLDDLLEIDYADGEANIENDIILNEELSFLRRELAFISREYREIVVPYYIEDRKLKDIASSLGLPEGTVKSKLFYARKKLKEGMNMAREFGKRSYRPEEVSFAASGNQPSGLPWSAITRKIPKNILLEASNNPSTLEELSVELGIALPYIEEEVDILHKATLLKKIEDKYITNFFIQSKECQNSLYFAKKRNVKKMAELVNRISTDSLDKIRALGVVRNNMSDNDLKWWVYIYLVDLCAKGAKGWSLNFPVKREGKGETWGFVGYEVNEDLKDSIGMGQNGSSWRGTTLWHYKIGVGDMWNKIPESHDYENVVLLSDIAAKGKKVSDLSGTEKDIYARIENKFAHTDEDGNIIPDVIVLLKGYEDKVREILKSHSNYKELENMVQSVFDEIVAILKKESNQALHDQLFYNASMSILGLRGLCLKEAIDDKNLIVPEHPEKTTIGISLHFYD